MKPWPSLTSTTTQLPTTQQQNTTVLPATTSDSLPISLPPSVSSTVLISIAPQSDIVEPPDSILIEHEIIGSAGPDKRESEGIQRALEWLKEKRSSDYGWENDTHMVILAKEVNRITYLFAFLNSLGSSVQLRLLQANQLHFAHIWCIVAINVLFSELWLLFSKISLSPF